MKLGQCQVESCYSPAGYGLYRTKPDGRKEWLYVCWLHQKLIGDENMRLAGGRYDASPAESVLAPAMMSPSPTR